MTTPAKFCCVALCAAYSWPMQLRQAREDRSYCFHLWMRMTGHHR